MVGKSLGHYEILEPLGSGGMGDVYRAYDTTLNRDVAIKVLPEDLADDPDRLARLKREAHLLAALNHPNVATIHGFEESDGTRFLVMELVKGESLEQRLASGALPVNEALDICRQIAEALEAAHDEGIIHRDLKPANVLITPEGRAKVLDFGLAKTVEREVSDADLSHSPTITIAGTETGFILGTAPYMSPEQVRGKPLDKRADIWAFGCVLYETLTGQRAFNRETVADTLAAILEVDPPWDALPASTPVTIQSLLRRCLRKDPKQRLRDIGDARIEIADELLTPTRSETPAAVDSRRSPTLRRYLLWASALVLTILASAVAAWTIRGRQLEDQGLTQRYQVAPPEGVYLADAFDGAGIALSPRGGTLAFFAFGKDTGIYLRSMNEIGGAHVSNGRRPFFSPDGVWLGFFEAGKLWKVSMHGGQPQEICDARDPYGGSWLENGTIVFADSGSLWRVSDSSGVPDEIVGPDSDGGVAGQSYRWPQALPGDDAVVFTIWESEQRMKVALLPLDGADHRILIEHGTSAHYVPTGHLVYAWETDILAVPFDLATLRATGDPISVIQDALPPLFPGQALFGVAENGTLAYVPQTDVSSKVTWVSRSGQSQTLAFPSGRYGWPNISPDGNRLLFVRLSGIGDIASLWIADLEAPLPQPVTDDEANDWHPVWTNDGSSVVYCSTRQTSRQGTMYWQPVDQSEPPERLVPSEDWPCPHSFSPEGDVLAYRMIDPETGYDIWMLPMEGDGEPWPFVKTPALESWPRFSPDGKWVAYHSTESGPFEIYVKSSEARSGRGQRISSTGGCCPVWSPDGSEIFYINEDALMVVSFQADPVMSFGSPREISDGHRVLSAPGGGGAHYDIRPDGEGFVMIERGESRRIRVVLNWFEELKRQVPTGR